jgi:hypothetical protein
MGLIVAKYRDLRPMLSAKRFREILGNCELSDKEINLLRDALYGVARTAVRCFEKSPPDEITLHPDVVPFQTGTEGSSEN